MRLSKKISSSHIEYDEHEMVDMTLWDFSRLKLSKEAAELEEKLAEYENDETARRRADAYKIRQLEDYKKEVEEVTALMFQFSMRRINEKSPAKVEGLF